LGVAGRGEDRGGWSLGGGPENIELFFDGGEVLVAGGEGGFAEGGEGGGETVGVGELVMGAEFCERCG